MMRKLALLFLPLLLIAGSPAVLPKAAAAQEDPPGRVARLNYMEGSVSYQVSGDTDWVQADPNRPLTTGDNLWADKDSRAEVHIGSTAIRLSSETGISILNLDDRTVQLQLPQGTIEVHLRHHAAGDAFEVDTPNVALTLTQSGEYRISTDPNGASSVVVVREGAIEATGGGESYDLAAGQQYTFTGTDQLAEAAGEVPPFDDFEDWCQARDQRENNALSAKYVSRDVDGYYDLDEYGDWQADSDYGMIWVPRGVEAGWVPYHFGHWVWISPWGWTWVDQEPWGFAPFHYGRWVFARGYWGWVPGPVVVRPVYAPALVAFVGGGGAGFGFSVAFGGGLAGVAWFPLGPRDVFVPGYRCSPRYMQMINVTNTRAVNVTQITTVYNNYTRNVNVTETYMYAHNGAAVTAVSRDTFVNARPVREAALHVTPEQIESARAVQSVPLQPTHASYVSASAKVATAKPEVPFAERPAVARLNPPEPANNRNRPPEVYTNDSRPFNQEPVRTNNAPPPAENSQASRQGFQPFHPSSGTNNTAPNNTRNNSNSFTGFGSHSQNQNQQQNQQRPSVKFAPPVQARDEMYDVHPPLNQKEQHPQPQPKSESHGESKPH